MTIKAITFDFWATLYKSKTVDYAQRLLELKEEIEQGSGTAYELEQVKAAVRAARDTWRQTWLEEHRTLGADEWLDVLLQALGTALGPADVLKIQRRLENSVLYDRPTLVPEARGALTELSRRYRLAIISDTGLTPGRVLRQLLAEDEIISYFNQLTFSDEVGHSKPHPDAFLTTLRALGVTPAEAVHVGDLLRTDVAGAQGVGMRAVQYTGLSQDDWIAAVDESARSVVPDAIIVSHTELKSLLQQWNGAKPA